MADSAMVTRDLGPAVERDVVKDMLSKRAVKLVPVLLFIALLGWGVDGLLSSAFACAVVLVNFAVAAALLSATARVSFGLMMGVALFGYLLRLGVVFAAVLLVHDLSWFSVWPLGLSLVITHLGLLLWETRYISASLAFPGLKPSPAKPVQKGN